MKFIPALLFVVLGLIIGCGGGGGSAPPVDPPDPPGSTAGLAGRVVDQSSTAGLGGVVLRFYTASGAKIGEITTKTSGEYAVKIDPSATLLQVVPESIPLGFHRAYWYSTRLYAPTLDNCKAPLPALDTTRTTTLPTISLLPTYDPPPPPPSGCR